MIRFKHAVSKGLIDIQMESGPSYFYARIIVELRLLSAKDAEVKSRRKGDWLMQGAH